MNRLACLLALVASVVSVPAFADCDYESHRAGSHGGVVPDWSYSHVVTMPEASAPFPECEAEAEDLECEAEGLTGLGCAAKMQRLYAACVGQEMCRDAAQGWLEDDGVTGEALASMYSACLDLVAVSGGEF